jgi:hypothetical protein
MKLLMLELADQAMERAWSVFALLVAGWSAAPAHWKRRQPVEAVAAQQATHTTGQRAARRRSPSWAIPAIAAVVFVALIALASWH